jgi:phosphatidylinositol alpha-1,6-mannosyltransferase
MRILVLVSEAFGGHGGIAKFNRDLLAALCAYPGIEEVVGVPRLVPESPGVLPAKLNYVTSAVGGKLHYVKTLLTTVLRLLTSDVLICGHINLLPLAFLARLFLRPLKPGLRPPIILVIHGIDAWQPMRSRFRNYFVRKIDAFISVSDFTQRRFLDWAKLNGTPGFILSNCVDLAQFTPGPKHPALLERYGLRDRTVLLTVARLSAQEHYKGIDEVMEVLSELARTIPDLSYLIVGDGNDRPRLVAKARSLGLGVTENPRPDLRPLTSVVCPPLTGLRPLTSGPQVIFAGRIPEEEKADHYRLADAFVMPGWGEGFGIVYLEAMACGLPVIGSKLDASCEVLKDGKLGIVVDPAKSQEIILAIKKALQTKKPNPEGLEYFSYPHFEQRCHQLLNSVVSLKAAGNVLVGKNSPADRRDIPLHAEGVRQFVADGEGRPSQIVPPFPRGDLRS